MITKELAGRGGSGVVEVSQDHQAPLHSNRKIPYGRTTVKIFK